MNFLQQGGKWPGPSAQMVVALREHSAVPMEGKDLSLRRTVAQDVVRTLKYRG